MDEGRWKTKEDIQKDLARAAGQRIPDVDEGYFVYGERPPPPRICDEDCELELHFGRDLIGTTTATLNQPPPDLQGITKMLQMVQTYDNGNWIDNSDTHSSKDDVIVISKPNVKNAKQKLEPKSTNSEKPKKKVASKLNPNVQEFVPRAKVSCSSQISKCSLGDCDKENNSDNNTFEPKEAEAIFDRHQIEQAVTHNKVYNTPQRDESRELRRHEYAAIANILKLHSLPLKGPIKLRTPDFFSKTPDFYSKTPDLYSETSDLYSKTPDLYSKTPDLYSKTPDLYSKTPDSYSKTPDLYSKTPDLYSKTPDFYCKANASDHAKKITADKSTLTEPDAKELAVASVRLGGVRLETDVAGSPTTHSEPTVSTNAKKEVPEQDNTTQTVDENEVKASIHKVSNWLDGKPSGPSPTNTGYEPHLGPISYKRKKRPEPNQPPSQLSHELPSPGAYVPSPHASELGLQYLERSRTSPIQSPNLWQQLEADLKKRDAEIARDGRRDASATRLRRWR